MSTAQANVPVLEPEVGSREAQEYCSVAAIVRRALKRLEKERGFHPMSLGEESEVVQVLSECIFASPYFATAIMGETLPLDATPPPVGSVLVRDGREFVFLGAYDKQAHLGPIYRVLGLTTFCESQIHPMNYHQYRVKSMPRMVDGLRSPDTLTPVTIYLSQLNPQYWWAGVSKDTHADGPKGEGTTEADAIGRLILSAHMVFIGGIAGIVYL